MEVNMGMVNSIHDCYNMSLQNAYAYFSLQWGGQCWLSNNYTKATTMYGICGQCDNNLNACGNVGCSCDNM